MQHSGVHEYDYELKKITQQENQLQQIVLGHLYTSNFCHQRCRCTHASKAIVSLNVSFNHISIKSRVSFCCLQGKNDMLWSIASLFLLGIKGQERSIRLWMITCQNFFHDAQYSSFTLVCLTMQYVLSAWSMPLVLSYTSLSQFNYWVLH